MGFIYHFACHMSHVNVTFGICLKVEGRSGINFCGNLRYISENLREETVVGFWLLALSF